MKTRVETSIISHEVARRLLLKQPMEEIAQAMGIAEKTLQNHIRKPAFQTLLNTLQEQMYRPVDRTLGDKQRNLTEEISQAAFKSFDRLNALLDAASEQTRMHVAQDILDRAGYGKKQIVQTEGTLKIDTLDAQILLQALDADKRARERVSLDPSALSGTPHPMKDGNL
jgi:hypothetical protein